MREKWSSLPRWARWVLAVYLIGFGEGACVHLYWVLMNGIHTFAHFPMVSQVYLNALALLDPLVVVLAARVRRSGILLAVVVMTLDVTTNWIGNWPWVKADPARLLQPVGLLPITLFGLFVLLSAVPLLRVTTDTAERLNYMIRT
ncbi:hypothetical protein [Streptomyces guryensis]|uniref:Uncharacterized protein n=1 Tax=Streptomyces guryensis TaxID=2886947 RepID=A0A9Q3VQ28_9ACTN|nr:hypothetical protein [Streptomyces guryensis]MCD9876564.1 hypothetical protein [Streptomyces guryensis]